MSQRILYLPDLATSIIDRLIATAAMHPSQAATQKPALAQWMEDAYGQPAPPVWSTTLDQLVAAFHDHADPPLTLRPGCRAALQVVLEQAVQEERLRIADELERQAGACNGSARFALEGVAGQLRGAGL